MLESRAHTTNEGQTGQVVKRPTEFGRISKRKGTIDNVNEASLARQGRHTV